MSVSLILMVAAIVLLILAALGVGSPRVSLGWAGLACWALSLVIR